MELRNGKKTDMYYLTTGYPLGTKIEEGRLIYRVSLNGRYYPLIPVERRIWEAFLLGAYEEEVIGRLSEADRSAYQVTMQKFCQQTGLLQQLDEPAFTRLGELLFLRQGIGEGLDIEDGTYKILFRQQVTVTESEYEIWCMADGSTPCRVMEQRLSGGKVTSFRETVIRMCRKGLLIASGRE